MTLKMFTRGHRSKPWFVAAEKELFGLCGAVMLHTPVVCCRGCPQWPARRAECQRHKRLSHVSHTRLAKWAELSKSHIEPNLVPGLWIWISPVSVAQGSSDQWWADHIPSTPTGSSDKGRGSCCLFCCSEVRAFMFSIAAVLLALHQLAPNPPAWQFTREGKETWPESMEKAEIMDFRGGSPLSDLHTPCQDLHVLTCVIHQKKTQMKKNRFFFFFAYNPTEWRIFFNLITKAFSFSFQPHFLRFYLSPSNL